jgi:hypothetical protein
MTSSTAETPRAHITNMAALGRSFHTYADLLCFEAELRMQNVSGISAWRKNAENLPAPRKV